MAAIVSASRIIEVPVSEDQVRRARIRAASMSKETLEKYKREHLNDSILAGQGVFPGLLAEEIKYDFAVARWQVPVLRPQGSNVYHCDMIVSGFGSIDVKAKQQKFNGAPLGFYNGTVCDANTWQECDWYCFMRVHESFKRAWLLGLMRKADFLARATFGRKGDIDPTSHNGFRFKWDCWNVPISDLLPTPTDPAGFRALVEANHLNETRGRVVA